MARGPSDSSILASPPVESVARMESTGRRRCPLLLRPPPLPSSPLPLHENLAQCHEKGRENAHLLRSQAPSPPQLPSPLPCCHRRSLSAVSNMARGPSDSSILASPPVESVARMESIGCRRCPLLLRPPPLPSSPLPLHENLAQCHEKGRESVGLARTTMKTAVAPRQ
uniref:Uncharacterized protein n=1 Tax=Oryza rufipogon TaxID=4529 RepID=A0A0E0NZM2_ORYRU